MKILLFLAALSTAAIAAEVKIELPTPAADFKPGKGADLAQAHCLICHSSDYISTQPPMARKFWEATLKKMKEKFGAPTPDDALPALAEYLTATYGLPTQTP